MPNPDQQPSLDTQRQIAGRSDDADTPAADADDGPLESLGKSVSSPLLGSEADERAKARPAGERRSGRNAAEKPTGGGGDR